MGGILVDPARYEAISVARFAEAMDRCLAQPSPRNARAALRLTREQLLARPGNQFEQGRKGLGALFGVVLAFSGYLWRGSDPFATSLRNSIPAWVPGIVLAMIAMIGFGGWKASTADGGDREEILRLARTAWSTLKEFDDGEDDTYATTRKLLNLTANPS